MGAGPEHASPQRVAACFSRLGGRFLAEPPRLARRLREVRGLVFDWDGVFNRGVKAGEAGSPFVEADSMGTNLLRYALWRRHRALPPAAIITGEANDGAERFALREHLHALYSGIRGKAEAMTHFCAEQRLDRRQIACFFDDVNDLAMAGGCGVRILVRRDASPLWRDYVVDRGLCDYVTGTGPEGGAVREAAELLTGLLGAFEAVIDSRAALDAEYAAYLSARQAVRTRRLRAADLPSSREPGAAARDLPGGPPAGRD